MLQQILSDLYVDPVLLTELDEEQRQLLFFKMRQEQVRRYDDRETSGDSRPRKPPRPGRRQVRFMQDIRGDPWVWIMGEHSKDLSIEDLIELDFKRKADRVAEMQADVERDQLEDGKTSTDCNSNERTTNTIELCRQQLHRLEHECSNVNNTVFKVVQTNRRRDSIQDIEQAKDARSSAIFCSLKVAHLKKMAEDDCSNLENNWLEQERKSKEKEAETKETMRRVRRMISQSSLDSLQDVELDSDIKQWPAKPASREDAVRWFKESECLQNAGIDPTTEKPYDWLHGIITRQRAEFLLFPKPEGTFLIRVSDRVRGYVLSYRTKEKCRHYLIDVTIVQLEPALRSKYTFLGGDQREHHSLRLLVDYHRTNKITEAGEKLLISCGQQRDELPDHAELFQP